MSKSYIFNHILAFLITLNYFYGKLYDSDFITIFDKRGLKL